MITKKLMVKNGSYQAADGTDKNRWIQIGAMHEYDGREYITLDRHVNLAGLPTKEGETRVFVSLFDPDEDRKTQQSPTPQRRTQNTSKAQPFKESALADDPNDDIPF